VDPVDPAPVDPVDPVDPAPVDPVDPVDPAPVDPVDEFIIPLTISFPENISQYSMTLNACANTHPNTVTVDLKFTPRT
jgi:hypothetical protein